VLKFTSGEVTLDGGLPIDPTWISSCHEFHRHIRDDHRNGGDCGHASKPR
jgi:hypothetical protein